MQAKLTRRLVLDLARKHFSLTGTYQHYPGIVTMHAVARLATVGNDAEGLDFIRLHILPFVRGERDFPGNFPNYNCGGNASAWLLWRGVLPEAKDAVARYAEITVTQSQRDSEGIISHPKYPGEGRLFIDSAFAVSPFLLYAGLALGAADYIKESWRLSRRLVETLHDPQTGLVHQARGFQGPGIITSDHWSRGNGWAVLALAELAANLPEDREARAARTLFLDLLRACLRYQDEASGLWRQEIPQPKSYVETSGSALILYGLGIAIERGWLDEAASAAFLRGVRGLLDYVTDEMDVFHVCTGCLAPGEGRPIDYMAKPPRRNDHHGFGAMGLAFGQAHILGHPTLTAL